MNAYLARLKAQTKEQGILWQPLLLILIGAFIVYLLLADAHYSNNQLMDLYEPGIVSKVKMKVSSKAGVHTVVLRDSLQLDSINSALVLAKPLSVAKGGAFDTWADMQVYKDGHKIDIRVNHSVANGWMIDIGNETLGSDYIVALVQRYARP